MPLTNIIYPNSETTISCWTIKETVSELYKGILIDEKLTERLANSVDKRKKELLAARHLLKKVQKDEQYKIIYDVNRKPFLENSSKKISITHSKDKLAIVISLSKNVGLDIEQLRNTVLRIKHKFLSEEELGFVQEDILKCTIYWSAKESLYKFYGKKEVDFRKELILNNFVLKRKGNFQAKIVKNNVSKSMNIYYYVFGEYVMTYCSESL